MQYFSILGLVLPWLRSTFFTHCNDRWALVACDGSVVRSILDRLAAEATRYEANKTVGKSSSFAQAGYSLVVSGKDCRPHQWLGSQSLEACFTTIQAHAECSQQYFIHAGLNGGDFNCGCITDVNTDCLSSEHQFDAGTVGIYKVNQDTLEMPTIWWNSHWQCSSAEDGAAAACSSAALSYWTQSVQQSGAQIAGTIELFPNVQNQQPSAFATALNGWTQVNGFCQANPYADQIAIAFAAGWKIEASSGGCLSTSTDARVFVVARVVPPSGKAGSCSKLCVVGIHAPHGNIVQGRSTVQSICGSLTASCTVAFGDWNTPAAGVPTLWAQLIGGTSPPASLVAPDQESCCWPQTTYYGVFDHLATNLAGAQITGSTVYDYPITDQHPTEEHKPVLVNLVVTQSARDEDRALTLQV